MDETIGICDGVPLDMNFATGATTRGDGQYTAGAMDIIGNGDTLDRSDDFDQWGHMLLDIRHVRLPMASQLTVAVWIRALAVPMTAVLVAGCSRQAEPPANTRTIRCSPA